MVVLSYPILMVLYKQIIIKTIGLCTVISMINRYMTRIVYKQNNLQMLANTSNKTLEADKNSEHKGTSQTNKMNKKGNLIVPQPNIRSFVNKKYHQSLEDTQRQFKISNKPAKNDQTSQKDIRPTSIQIDQKGQNTLVISQQLIRSTNIYKQLQKLMDDEKVQFKKQETELLASYKREEQQVQEMTQDNKVLSQQVQALKKKLQNLEFQHKKEQHKNMYLLETINQMNEDQFFIEEEEEYEQNYQITKPSYYENEEQEGENIGYYTQTYYINNNNEIMHKGGSQGEEEQS